MAAHASSLAEEVFAVVDGLPLHVAAGQHHVGRVAILATRLRIFLGIQRPEPVLVVSVRFLYARGGAAVALMARRASELFGIMNLQQLRFRMAGESFGIFIGLLLAFRSHRSSSDFHRLARVHVAGLAAVHNIGFGHIDLNDCRIPVRRLLLQSVDLLRRQVDHVVGDVFVHLRLGRGHRLKHFAEFQTYLRAFVANPVISLLELPER